MKKTLDGRNIMLVVVVGFQNIGVNNNKDGTQQLVLLVIGTVDQMLGEFCSINDHEYY